MSFDRWRSLVDGAEIDVGAAIPDNLVDNFEDADADSPGVYESGETIDDYYGGRADAIVRTTDSPIEGDKSATAGDVSDFGLFIVSEPGMGLNHYPDFGATVSALVQENDGRPGIPGIVYNGALGTDDDTGYCAEFDPANGQELRIRRLDGQNNPSVLNGEPISIDGTVPHWIEFDIPVENGDSHEVRLYEWDNPERGDLIATVTATDDQYTDQNGIGVVALNSNPGGFRVDRIREE